MTLEEYAKEIDELAVKCGALEKGKSWCPFLIWKDAFDDGLTLEQAWEEEYNPK